MALGLAHRAERERYPSPPLCKFCGDTNPDNMMNRGNGRISKNLCKKCHCENTAQRSRDNKRKYIEYKGGKCSKCGYDKCDAALEFHHLNPKEKDPTFKGIRFWGLEKAKRELDKCILVCCRCHREIHAWLA